MQSSTRFRAGGRKQLLAEMTVISLAAALFGVAWNHQLLMNAWSGKPVNSSSAATAPAEKVPLALPLGLLQAKEFFDSKEATFVDARDKRSFAEGHIQGAISLPLGEAAVILPTLKGKVPFSTMLVVYCNGYSCHDSKDLADRLIAAGWRQVFVFEGGFPEWQDNGNPVAKGE